MKSQFLLSPLVSDGGKSLLSLGLMRALRRQGMKVQPFSCGPDLADKAAHEVATGCASVNLDAWYASRGHIQYLYNTYGEQAYVCVVDNSAGLFDGFRKWQGSGADIAQALSVPVILLANARSSTYSLAPMLFGFKRFRQNVRIAGVIFYHVFSPAQYGFLREVCADAGMECLGYLPYDESLRMPAKYSTLTSAVKAELDGQIQKAADLMRDTLDLDKLLNLTTRIFPCAYSLPYTSEMEPRPQTLERKWRIAVASDPAFHFIYQENLSYLKEVGSVSFFSPVYGNDIPEADLIYLPGGFPELFARQLHRWKRQLQQLREFGEDGGKILAEGGGIALLSRTLTARPGGTAYQMAGLLPFEAAVREQRLYAGYRKADVDGHSLKGYEYRYFDVALQQDPHLRVIAMANLKGQNAPSSFVCRYKNTIAVTAHCCWGQSGITDWW